MNRILVIRGGAIGDFVLTLPALKLLREGFPRARLEVLSYKHIAALADNRFYADAVRSIESGTLARFFARNPELPTELRGYFGGFDLIVSYLYDPDGIFADSVGRCGKARFVVGPSTPDQNSHAALQLARPLEPLGLAPANPAAYLYPTNADRAAVAHFRRDASTIVFHPGSGSKTKNWPIENWRRLGSDLLFRGRNLLVVGGEADAERLSDLRRTWNGEAVQFAENLALPHLAALIEACAFVGHDSGVSHIAAAVGARCVLLFGPSNPAVWAPANQNVTVLRAPDAKMDSLSFHDVEALVPSA
jgi:heptosyltransferase-2